MKLFFPVFVCAWATTGCDRVPDVAAGSDKPPAVSRTVASVSKLEPALLGKWRPYDNDANARLGELDVQSGRLVFAKGLALRITPVSPSLARVDPQDGAQTVSGPDTLCGADPVLSVSFSIPDRAAPNLIRVSVHDIATGPGSDPDFDTHRCQTFTYVRDEPGKAS